MPSTEIPLSLTKIVVPKRRPELLTRARLLDMLYDFLDKKLILITAGAGYGKTSLLIDLAHQCELPFCWLALDDMDRNPQRFLAYFIASLAHQFPQFGSQSINVLNNLTSLENDLERLLVSLVNEINDRIAEHFILVLDDYHKVEDVAAIAAFLSRFIQLVGENCHIIISSRSLIALSDLSLLVARDQVEGLSFAELAFLPVEIQALFKQNYHLGLDDDLARQMAEETEGWITGLQLSKLATPQSEARRLRLIRASGVDLFEYLGQQVLELQPPEFQDFLLRSSLLEEFNPQLCTDVLDPFSNRQQNWQEMINTAIRNNLFILSVGEKGNWVRYHHLFQDFLKSKLKDSNPDLVEPILQRLVQVHSQNEEWEKAYHVSLQLGDRGATATVVEQAAPALLENGRLGILDEWLKSIPDFLQHEHPGLLSARGSILQIRGELLQAISLLNQAETAFRETGDAYNLALTLVRRAVVHRQQGNYTAALADVEEVLGVKLQTAQQKSLYAAALRTKGLVHHRTGQVKEAIRWLEESLQISRELNEPGRVASVLGDLGMVYRACGDYPSAEASLKKGLQACERENNPVSAANILNSLGVLYFHQGNYEPAIQAFDQGLKMARQTGLSRVEGLLLLSLGDLYTEIEAYEAATNTYQQAVPIIHRVGERFISFYICFAQVNLLRRQGKINEAWEFTHRMASFAQSGISDYERGLCALAHGQLLLSTGAVQEAIDQLSLATRIFDTRGQVIEAIYGAVWLSSACMQAGEKTKARVAFNEAVERSTQIQLRHPLLVSIRQNKAWIDSLKDDPNLSTTIRQTLLELDRFTSNLPAIRKQLRLLSDAVAIPPPRLVIKAFGQADVIISRRRLTHSDWQTQTVRELFFFFLSVPDAMSKEQVGESLWPGIEPAVLKLRFKNNIYRLRHAVGQNAITYDNDLYRFNRSLDYDYDVELFEARLNKARSSTSEEEQIKNYQAAVNLVRGPYLANVDAAWPWPERQRLQQDYLRATLHLAELYLRRKELRKALNSCQKTLETEPCLEEAHILAMKTYHAMGDRAGIVRQYKTCQENLKSEFDISPMSSTEELYQRLIS